MTDNPLTLYEMLRRALKSQVDLGLGEFIANRRPRSLSPLPSK